MVECTPVTVNAATRWLRGIETQSGSDALTALEMAFDEPRCDAVYLACNIFYIRVTVFVYFALYSIMKRFCYETSLKCFYMEVLA